MAYIGKSPVIGNFVKLDAITAVNGQAAYTMQNGGSNFTDYESVNQFLVSLNGTIQAPTDSFTVSGSTLTFASNLSTGDVIDFIMVFGNSLSAGTPTDATVSTAKIVDGAVTNSKVASSIINSQTAETSIADADEVLIYDSSASALRKMTKANFVSGIGGSNSSQFAAYASAGQSFNSGSYTKINIVNEFFDVDSDYDASNSKFVAPSAGKYFLYGQFALVRAGTFTGNPCHLKVRIYKNGSGIDYIGTIFSSTDGSRINIVNISAVVDASANDYFELYGYHDKGSAETAGGESLFQGFKLIS